MIKKLILLLVLLAPFAKAQQITSLNPTFTSATTLPYTLTVNGNGFTADAVVVWQGSTGTTLQTTFIDQHQLTAVVPCCFSAGVDTVKIAVVQASGTSPSVVFKNLGAYAPITSYSPHSFTQGVSVTLTVNGNYFIPASIIYFDNIPQTTAFVSPQQLRSTVSGSSIDGRHTHSIRVQYPISGSTVRLNPTTLNFGTVTVGNAPQLTSSLTNLGSVNLTISSIVKTGAAEFGQSNDCGSPRAPSSSCTFTVTFTPSGVGTFAGQIAITDSAVGSPHTISLTGVGAGSPSGGVAQFDQSSLSFGSIAVGGSSSPQTLTLTNAGASPMTITSVALASATNYSITDHCVAASPLASTSSCTVDVTFSPTTTGSLTTTLNFTDSAPGSPQQIPLSGTGTSTHYVDLAWTASASSGVTGYNVYRGTVSGGPYTQINGALITGTAYTDFAVTSGQHLCYVITSYAPSGYSPQESVYSGESCATVP
jgi:hypothetical protein